MTFFERLRAASKARGSLLCVGLDPDYERLGDARTALAHCAAVVERTADYACCYKPNAAFWEQYGPRGWEALATIRAAVPPDIPVMLDCKRADVPNTMAAYATAVFDAMQFDAATVHAYHGADSLAVFAGYQSKGTYVVCHTSNPGRADLQHLNAGGEPMYMKVADLAARANLAVVIGATAPAEAASVRKRFPKLPFLLPGIGRQGGDVEASVRAAYTGDAASCVIAVAGAIMYASDHGKEATMWRDRIRKATEHAHQR